jgi:hypothetical protein
MLRITSPSALSTKNYTFESMHTSSEGENHNAAALTAGRQEQKNTIPAQ